jgi:homogentisate 1,2-dioxygenase
VDPQQYRWKPLSFPDKDQNVTFVDGVKTMCGAGDPAFKDGLGIHLYAFNQNMVKTAFYSSDGDLLIVP